MRQRGTIFLRPPLLDKKKNSLWSPIRKGSKDLVGLLSLSVFFSACCSFPLPHPAELLLHLRDLSEWSSDAAAASPASVSTAETEGLTVSDFLLFFWHDMTHLVWIASLCHISVMGGKVNWTLDTELMEQCLTHTTGMCVVSGKGAVYALNDWQVDASHPHIPGDFGLRVSPTTGWAAVLLDLPLQTSVSSERRIEGTMPTNCSVS